MGPTLASLEVQEAVAVALSPERGDAGRTLDVSVERINEFVKMKGGGYEFARFTSSAPTHRHGATLDV